MAKFKNYIFIALLVFLFVEVLIIFPAHLERQEETTTTKKKQNGVAESIEETGGKAAEQKMGGVHLVESQSGQRDWELFAKSAEGSEGLGAWKLTKVRVLFYNREKVEFTVTGDKGTIDSKSKDIEITGNVITKSENGYTFRTPSISYSSKTRLILSPEQVLMQGPSDKSGAGIYLKGSKMTVSVDQSKMKIEGTVTAKKPAENGKSFDVQADGAEFSGKSREAKFFGRVRMAYDGMKIEGPEAAFIYSKSADVLQAVNVLGGVKVSDVDKFATSESMSLDLIADKYIFKGRPKVIQNNDELSGEEIIFLDGGKKVKVERVRAKVEKKDE